MRMQVAALVMIGGLSACSVTGAVVSVASTAVGVAADVGAAAVKGTYRAGKAVASTLESPPEREEGAVQLVATPQVTAAPEVPAASNATAAEDKEPVVRAEAPQARKSRVDRLAGY